MDSLEQVAVALHNPLWHSVARKMWADYPQVDVDTVWEWIQTDLLARVTWIKTLHDGHLPDDRRDGNPLDARQFFENIPTGQLPAASISGEMVVPAALCLKPPASDVETDAVLWNPVKKTQMQIASLPESVQSTLEGARGAYVEECVLQSVTKIRETLQFWRGEGFRTDPWQELGNALQPWRWLQVAEEMDRRYHSEYMGWIGQRGRVITRQRIKKPLCFEMVPWMKPMKDKNSPSPVYDGIRSTFADAISTSPRLRVDVDEDRRSAQHTPFRLAAARMSINEVCPLFLAWLQGDMWTTPKIKRTPMKLSF
jgi:hypothetical protein